MMADPAAVVIAYKALPRVKCSLVAETQRVDAMIPRIFKSNNPFRTFWNTKLGSASAGASEDCGVGQF